MSKKTIRTIILLTALTSIVITVALPFLPDVIPLHFGPTGAGTVANKYLLLVFIPVPALIYLAIRKKNQSRKDR